VALMWPTLVRAQAVVDGGFGVAVVRAPTLDDAPGPSLPASGIGGTTVAGMAGVSVQVGRRISLGAEIMLERSFDFSERALIGATIHGTFRETIIAGVVRYEVAPTLQLVGGMSVITPQLNGDFIGPSPETTFGAVAGVDAPLSIAPHLTFVPAFRIHLIRRTDPDRPPNILKQVGSLVFVPALLFRVTF